MKLLYLAVLVAALPAGAADFSLDVPFLTQALIQQRLELVSRKVPERRATLEKLFADVGCTGDSFTTEPFRGSKQPNLICTLKGTDPAAGVIVVGGHYDLAESGMGAIDDWSGAVMLPSLYETVKARPHRHDYMFIAFAAEEEGLVGSREYVKALTHEQRAAIRAMMNLECLGLTVPEIWASHADPKLFQAYIRVMNALRLQPTAVNVDKVGDDDAHSFRNAGIPTATLHSITQETFPLLHTSKDKVTAIHPADYYDAYRVAALLLAYLDT